MAGVPVVFVNPGGARRAWPFDGAADGLPMAATAAELVAAVPDALARRGQPMPEPLLPALGVGEGAIARVVASIRELTGREAS